jgi:hypothetical protein
MPNRRAYLGVLAAALAVPGTGCLDGGTGGDTPPAGGTATGATTPTEPSEHDHDGVEFDEAVSPDGIEAAELNGSGDADRLAAVERFPSEGARHVEPGTAIDYARTLPLSGPHYPSPTGAGFYAEPQPAGNLVHALEHGAVVVYYHPAPRTASAGDDDSAAQSLREFAATHSSVWASVIAVPNPNDEPAADYVLTAWRHRLYMDSYDPQTVYAFLSEYLGRGPENPVR